MRTVDGVQILTEQEKQELLRAEVYTRKLGVFVETGTYQGDMTAAMLPRVRRVYTIELHPQRAFECAVRFVDSIASGEVVLLEGDSTERLPWALEQIDEPCLIWLDAHHSDADSAGSHDTCPLRAELKACLASPFDHVIFCDDARFLSRGNWPSLAEIHEMAIGWNVSVADDIVRITR